MSLGVDGFKQYDVIDRVDSENLMFAYKVSRWVKKGPKHAYLRNK